MSGLIHQYERPQDNFTIVANEFLRNPDIKPAAFRVVAYLLTHGSTFKLDQRSIARLLNMGVNTVARAMRDLEKLGLLVRVECRDERGHRTADDLYISQTPFTPEQRESLTTKSVITDLASTDLVAPKEDQFNKKINEEISFDDQERQDEETGGLPVNVPATGSASVQAAFDLFWTQYPRKDGKKPALKKFTVLTKGADRDQRIAEIMAGLGRACAEWKRLGTERHYIPLPETWLNQERFLDGTEDQAAVQQSARDLASEDALVMSNPTEWLRGEWTARRVDRVQRYFRALYLPPELDIVEHGRLNLEQYRERVVAPYNRLWIEKHRDAILAAIAAKNLEAMP